MSFSDFIRAVAILFCTKFTDLSDNIGLQEFFQPFGLFGLGLRNEGGVRVGGIAVLVIFWCGVAVIFISKYGIAVFRAQAVCGEFKFYVAVIGEKIVVSR